MSESPAAPFRSSAGGDGPGDGAREFDERDRAAQRRGRAASRVSTVPLGMLALAFFAPSVRVCHEVVSPLGYIASDPLPASVVIPPSYLGALALAAATATLLARGFPIGPAGFSRTKRALAAYGALAALAALGALFVSVAQRLVPQSFASLALGAGVAFAFFQWKSARVTDGWSGWSALLCAFAWFSLGWPATWIMGGTAFFGSENEAGLGAYLYTGALLVLLAVTTWGAHRGRPLDDARAP